MMTERQQQFRVGIFVIVAMAIIGTMVFQFGQFRTLWENSYAIAVHFDEAPGVFAASPVEMNGVVIGKVDQVNFDDERGGVTVIVAIRQQFHLRSDTRARLVRSLLGDSTIAFTPGVAGEFLAPGAMLSGEPATDPMQIVAQFDQKLTVTLRSFEATSQEWTKVANNLNRLMDTQHGNIDVVIERTALALQQFTQTMATANKAIANANSVLGDPQYQENLRRSLEALPAIVNETHRTILAVRRTVNSVNDNLDNLNQVTAPLAKHSTAIVVKLDNSLQNLESLTGELNRFVKLAAKKDGSLNKFISDPDLYRNLNRSAESLSVLLRNLEPVVRDMRIFSDKIARHPEIIGVRGALTGSSGLKDLPENDPVRQSQLPPSDGPRRQ